MPSLKQRCSSLCTLDCKGLRVQQEHFHTQYPRAVSVQRLEHPLGEKAGLRRGGGRGGEGGRGRGGEKEVYRGEQSREQWPEDPCRETEKCGGRGWGSDAVVVGGVSRWWGAKRAEVGGQRNREGGNEEGGKLGVGERKGKGVERRDNDK